MTARIVLSVLIATLLTAVSTSAQAPGGLAPLAGRFVDPVKGLSLERAIARAIEQEPSLRAARSESSRRRWPMARERCSFAATSTTV